MESIKKNLKKSAIANTKMKVTAIPDNISGVRFRALGKKAKALYVFNIVLIIIECAAIFAFGYLVGTGRLSL